MLHNKYKYTRYVTPRSQNELFIYYAFLNNKTMPSNFTVLQI